MVPTPQDRAGAKLGICSGAEAAEADRSPGVTIVRVTEARYVQGHTFWLRFDDGLEGEVDLSDELEGPVFGPLRDTKIFRSFQLHPELHTVTCPDGADFAPEFLHERVRVTA